LASAVESAFARCSTRIEVDGDGSRMQGDDVRLSYSGETRLLAIDLGLEFGQPSADHASRHLALGDCVDQASSLAAHIL
jgi:hypothetical protein